MVRTDTVPVTYIPARRVRHIREGDTIYMLPEPSGEAPPLGYTEPIPEEAYKVHWIDVDGIHVRPLAEHPGTLPRKYHRVVVSEVPHPKTTLVRAADATTHDPTALFAIDRRIRRLKATTNARDTTDSWPSRNLTVFAQGKPVEASRVGDDLLDVSMHLSAISAPIPAQIRVRDAVQGQFATPTVIDDAVQQNYLDLTGSVYPRLGLGSSTLYDLDTGIREAIQGGFLEFTPAPPVLVGPSPLPPEDSILTSDAFRGPAQGPLSRGGPAEFGPWSYAQWKVGHRVTPSFQEFREDVGRAYADLGITRTLVRVNVLATIVDRDSRLVELTDISPAFPNPTLVEGMDVLYPDAIYAPGPQPDPPYRVERVVSTSPEVHAILTMLPDTDVPKTVRLLDTSIAQAWREVRAWVTYLDEMAAALAVVQPPAVRFIEATALRLRRAGYETAARDVERCKFSSWLDPVRLSSRDQLAARLDALVSSLVSRRRSVFDE